MRLKTCGNILSLFELDLPWCIVAILGVWHIIFTLVEPLSYSSLSRLIRTLFVCVLTFNVIWWVNFVVLQCNFVLQFLSVYFFYLSYRLPCVPKWWNTYRLFCGFIITVTLKLSKILGHFLSTFHRFYKGKNTFKINPLKSKGDER